MVESRQTGAAPWREPVRGGHPDRRLLELPGIEQLRRMAAGETPIPPLSRLTGMRFEEVTDGEVTFTMPLTRWLVGADGSIAPGALAIPADAAMACAILTKLPGHSPLTTCELALRMLRPISPGGLVRARGRIVSLGSPVALAEALIADENGDLIAHATSLCITPPPGSAPVAGDGAPDASEGQGPDPWQREPQPGREAPLHQLTGLSIVSAGGGGAEVTLPASPWFQAPPPGRVQGGVVALLADAALSAAIGTIAPSAYAPLELKLNYLRPLASDGRAASANARVMYAGRRISVATAELLDADRRPIAVVTGSSLLSNRR